MKLLKGCVAAFRFLTIIPLPTSFGSDTDDLAGAVPFFPIVGICLGLFASGAAWVLWLIFPPLVAAVLLTFLLLSFSGALHLDGLADTADGFFSARDRARTLVIMRDSRIGVMGVTALVILLLLKVSCMAALSRSDAVRAAFLIPVAGRCGLVVMMYMLQYVRREGGLGTLFFAGNTGWPALFGMIIIIIMGFAVNGIPGLVTVTLAMVTVVLFSLYCRHKIGGATGDTLGAACEIAEAAVGFGFILNL